MRGMEKFFNTAGLPIVICEQLCQLRFVNNRSRMPIFDEDKSKTWNEKLYNRDVELNGKTLHIVGL